MLKYCILPPLLGASGFSIVTRSLSGTRVDKFAAFIRYTNPVMKG